MPVVINEFEVVSTPATTGNAQAAPAAAAAPAPAAPSPEEIAQSVRRQMERQLRVRAY